MYTANFDYYRARSVADAQALLAAHPGAKLLAGGHSLVPLLKLRLAAPSALVDIGRIAEMRGITREAGDVRIGALTTHAELATSSELRTAAPALAEAAATVGDPAVRNRGTIGGNVAHADPASDLPTVLVALDARMVALGAGGQRTIAADGFFTGIMTTALGDDEILLEVRVPAAQRGEGAAYEKFAHPASRYAVVGAAAWMTVKDGVCTAVRVSVGGLVPFARRLTSIEHALSGRSIDNQAIADASQLAKSDLGEDVTGDIFASGEYRAAMAPVYIRRALSNAFARASLG
jgi:aerobic carbon-monoxide dehydrogenase medium subunit